MAENTMDYLSSHNDDDNYLMMGDFNLYSSSEPAYQQFLNYSNSTVRFYDPLDMPGNWHNSSSFSSIHTQSTHADNNGCASYGGMDDRFDFILISNNIRKGYKKVKYLQGSFNAVGQDGNHFNNSINSSPQNSSVPANVANALYGSSDHLPVTMKLIVEKYDGIEKPEAGFEITTVNPVKDKLRINFRTKQDVDVTVELIDLTGRIRMKRIIKGEFENQNISIPINDLEKGFYILRLYNGQQFLESKKIIKR